MHWVGFDVGKAFHWVCVLDGEGEVVLSRRVAATEERIEEVLSEVSGFGEPDGRVVQVPEAGDARRGGEGRPRRGDRLRDPLRTKDRLRELDGRLEGLVETDPGGEVVRSLPGMGLVLTAEFLAEAGDASRFVSADRLAAAAGIVPVSRSSGSVSYQRRERRGNRVLRRIFYRSAFGAISCHGPSQDYYRRKRSEGKTAQQAVIALARRRVNVLRAMLRDGSIYEDRATAAA